jgi:hypothetical protein
MYSGAVAAIGAALVFLGIPHAASAVSARRLVNVRGEVSAFAQGGTQIAWANRRSYDSYVVQIRSLTTGTSAVFVTPYDIELELLPRGLAVAGTRAVWVAERCSMDCWDIVWTGAVGERSKTRLASIPHGFDLQGTVVGRMAGDGGTLAYSTEEWQGVPRAYLGGELWRVTGRAQTVVPSAPGAVVLAVSSERIAIVPGTQGTPDTYDPTVSIELRDSVSGGLLRTITAGGNVRALAFWGTKIAALVETPLGAKMIERYDAGTGALLGSTWVSPGIAAELDMAGNRIVYRTGRAIRLMDAITGAKQLLLQPSFKPIGLSIEGRRVAWAVNRDDGGRIMAVTLP